MGWESLTTDPSEYITQSIVLSTPFCLIPLGFSFSCWKYLDSVPEKRISPTPSLVQRWENYAFSLVNNYLFPFIKGEEGRGLFRTNLLFPTTGFRGIGLIFHFYHPKIF